MRRQWLALVACATVVATSGSAQGPSSDTIKPFNGTSLAGWHTEKLLFSCRHMLLLLSASQGFRCAQSLQKLTQSREFSP